MQSWARSSVSEVGGGRQGARAAIKRREDNAVHWEAGCCARQSSVGCIGKLVRIHSQEQGTLQPQADLTKAPRHLPAASQLWDRVIPVSMNYEVLAAATVWAWHPTEAGQRGESRAWSPTEIPRALQLHARQTERRRRI